MKPLLISVQVMLVLCLSVPSPAQTRKLAAIGSSTTAGLATSRPDSSWIRRISYYYKNQLGVLDTAYNLGVSSSNIYHGMPSSYTPPAGRSNPDPLHNVTRAVNLLADVAVPANGVIIVGFPTGGYDTYTIAEILSAFQRIYDSATRTGNRCYITTTQPRTDGNFAASAVKRKLAILKDSIINRFGVGRTINFWDGMFNPADTTILAAYSAGDNVHFNNAGHRVLFERVRAKNIFNLALPAYRSNVNPTGTWNDAASWQVLNGSTWVTATIPPSAGSGVITIQAGDSIRINTFAELDQVVVDPGGVLTIFSNTGTPAPLSVATLNDDTGDDLINNGRVYISGNGVLNGNGSIRNNSSGLFTIRNRGVLQTNLVNDGTLWINSTGIVRDRTVTNNKLFVLADFTIQLIRSTFINNDSMSITGGAATFIADSTLSGGFFTNTSSGKIVRQATGGSTSFGQYISFSNSGQLKGNGTYIINNPVTGVAGQIHPGTSPGRLTVNPALFNGRTPIVHIELSTNGVVQGVNYDHLIISDINTTVKNISGATLRVVDNNTDPVGTEYTIITPASGTITGTFAQVQLSPSLTGPFYHNGSYISVIKSFALPLTWGNIGVRQAGNDALIEWSTLQENNTDRFEIEHSVDGSTFTKIGVTAAAGESNEKQEYGFTHPAPSKGQLHYYRIRQVDIDGRFTYSKVVALQLNDGADKIVITPNPARNFLQITSTINGTAMLVNSSGQIKQTIRLTTGVQRIELNGILPGTYMVVVYDAGKKIETKMIVIL